jgi:uncharacterized protein (UPF0262 family)
MSGGAPAQTRDEARRLVSVVFDEASLARLTEEQDAERKIAVYDLVEDNVFGLPGRDDGPYALMIALHEGKIGLDVRCVDGAPAAAHILSFTPLRRTLKEYFSVCRDYFSAIRTATPAQIEAIDQHRRQLHDEGATILIERLAGKIEVDFETARRLFTLVTALQWRG